MPPTWTCVDANLPQTADHRRSAVIFSSLPAEGGDTQVLSVATPAEPRGEKKLFFVQILGGEKLLKFVEKCQ